MHPELLQQIESIRADRHSGATELSRRAREALSASLAHDCTLETAVSLCRAQPAMAPIWNAAVAAIESRWDPDRWRLVNARWNRAAKAVESFAVRALTNESRSLHLLTCSMSAAVVSVVRRLTGNLAVRVSCSEGRPALEGRQLAATLAEAGIPVELFTDAALGTALDTADAVVVGADAIGPAAWINKSGTRLLAAAAHVRGVPVHVLATSDKLVAPPLWPHLRRPDASPMEVWESAPAGVRVRNPYFETISLDLATTVITDLGVLGADMVPDACAALDTPSWRKALDELLRARAD
jgi:translation initiation factor 2B subunit (eIF-2B alpha/beta/delta family)